VVPSAPGAGEIGAQARLAVLEEGIYSLSVGTIATEEATEAGIRFPLVQVSAAPSDDYDLVEIVAGSGAQPDWCDASGGVVVVKSPPGGGVVLLTTYGPAGVNIAIDVEITRLGRVFVPPPVPVVVAAAPVVAASDGREIRKEMVLHIEREGDRVFAAPGWAGTRGLRRRVEAFGIRPLEGLAPGDIEYRAIGPNGRETPWVTDAKLCGTRGRGLPLTGFAIRLASHLRDRFDVVYEGAFFESGIAGPNRNGEPCVSAVFDDPLEAINLRVIARRSG